VLVVDAGRSMNGRYMYNYPELRQYLDRNYCFMRYVDGEPVYRRRLNGDCPPADY
jgi:asparagine synthetase B (glutamine-hydrolysing)